MLVITAAALLIVVGWFAIDPARPVALARGRPARRAARSATSIDRIRARLGHRLPQPAAVAGVQPRRRRDHGRGGGRGPRRFRARAPETGRSREPRPSRGSSTSTSASRSIDKPAGLVVHPAPGHHGETLVSVLGDMLGGGEAERPGIVHRLDRDTSGLMIVARDDEAHRRLSAHDQGPRGRARPTWRWSRATCARGPGTIDAPLGRDHRAPEKRAVRGRGAASGPHPLHRGRGACRRHAGRGAPGDRPHPPDPRPLRGDRQSRGRRRALRRAPPPRARAASSYTARASASTTRSAARRSSSSRSCLRTSLPGWSWRGAAR